MKTIQLLRKGTSLFLFSLLLLFLPSCQSTTKSSIKPQLDFAVQDKYLQHLSPRFTPLTEKERETDWGKEYQIGISFARKLDLYNAVTSFKRAEILLNSKDSSRKAEIQYQLISAYYLGKRYYDVIDIFENSLLIGTDRNFVGFHDLLVILFESYTKCEDEVRATRILHALQKHYPIEGEKLAITSAFIQADLKAMHDLSHKKDYDGELLALQTKENLTTNDLYLISDSDQEMFTPEDENRLKLLKEYRACQESADTLLTTYKKYKKSPNTAAILNGILPGAGYLYLGQKQSAFTSFCINGLFIATAGYFFHQGNIPAAAITTSFEAGWYLGGIIGAKEAAVFYNERLFETHAHYHMRDHKLYPILMLNYGF